MDARIVVWCISNQRCGEMDLFWNLALYPGEVIMMLKYIMLIFIVGFVSFGLGLAAGLPTRDKKEK